MKLKALIPWNQSGTSLKAWNEGADHVVLRAKERFGVTMTRADVRRLELKYELYEEPNASVYLTTLPDGQDVALFVSPRGRPSTIMHLDWALNGKHSRYDTAAHLKA